jgi:serine/threonine protein kinase
MNRKMMQIPVITSKEIGVSKILGEGGFCTVSAVRKINIELLEEDEKIGDDDGSTLEDVKQEQGQKETSSPPSQRKRRGEHTKNCTNLDFTSNEEEARRRFAKQFKDYEKKHFSSRNIVLPGQRNSNAANAAADPAVQRPPKLALKRVKTSLKEVRYKTGVNDLMAEISILSKCSHHPNIITLHAIGFDERDASSSESTEKDKDDTGGERRISFAIIDQLRSTLKDRIYKWKDDRGSNIMNRSKKTNELWLERLVVMMKCADAIAYLHSRGIVHRDINPGNIGFTEDNVVKLFDFGLAKQLRFHNRGDDYEGVVHGSGDDNELFDLTGNTGTLRYMAPEIAHGGSSHNALPYGFKVDVYSFALVMHEVLSLSKPYVRLNAENFHDEVVKGGARPPLNELWPVRISELLERMWSTDVAIRPSSKEVVEVLGELLRGDDVDLYPTSRYSYNALKQRLFNTTNSPGGG